MKCPNCKQDISSKDEREFIKKIGYCYTCDAVIGNNEENLQREEEHGETEDNLFHRG